MKLDMVRILGSTRHSVSEREKNDFYATDPQSVLMFLKKIRKDNICLSNHIWENACGDGAIAKVLKSQGYSVFSTDIFERGYADALLDFTFEPSFTWMGDVMTNPPYKHSIDFVKNSIRAVPKGNLVIMYLRLQFVEGIKRRSLYEDFPPKYIYVHSSRQKTYKNNDKEAGKNANAVCFAWFIWEKGYRGDTVLRWL
tara:strand:+ start:77 stop:667 length:591 start_codon:yes stop_codon:yes gene_type:complete